MTLSDFQDSEIYMSGPDVNEDDIKIVTDMLKNGWYGKKAYEYVEKFETEFAKWHSRDFGIMTPNCTSSIHLILTALGIGPGDEVIVPESTWIGSAAPIIYLGAKPVFADVDFDSWCITLEEIEKKTTSATKAIICVNLYGAMPNYSAIEAYCRDKGLFLIEDAAESLGSTFCEKKSGSFGIASVFSFHRTKTLTTGEGGMLLVSDPELNKRLRFLRDHGRRPGEFYNTEVTYKYMPSNLSAALGYSQFNRIEQLLSKKRAIFENYRSSFAQLSFLNMNKDGGGTFNSAWCSVISVDENNSKKMSDLTPFLTSKGIPTRPFFYPLSSLPAFTRLGLDECAANNPISRKLFQNSMCLPSALNLSKLQQDFIISSLMEFFENEDVT